jgi:hypothetical protein
MLAEPAAMEQVEQKVAKAPMAVEAEKDVVAESEIAIDNEVVDEKKVVAEKEIATEREVVVENKVPIGEGSATASPIATASPGATAFPGATREAVEAEKVGVQKTGTDVAGGAPPDDDNARVLATEAGPGEAKAGTAYAVTSTLTVDLNAAQVAEESSPVEPAPSPEAELMSVAPAPSEPWGVTVQAGEPSMVQPLPEPPVEQPLEPTSGEWPSSTRVVLRIVEIGLGVTLVGLIVTVVLLRRRTY